MESAPFKCDMDGYVELVSKGIKNVLWIPTLIKEIYVMALPTDLGLAVEYGFDAFISAFAILGYFISMVYYIGEELGFGEAICSVGEIADKPITHIYTAFNLSNPKPEDATTTTS
tara:strand:+ start:65 stop:409 length:345 start_codon:yes stop_codon:yes gene_type:complete